MFIKFIQILIDLLRRKKNIYIHIQTNPLYIWKKNIKNAINIVRNNYFLNKKIKVAFLCMYSTDCQNFNIFEKMLNDVMFDPYFIINPDVSKDKKYFLYN